MDSKQSSNKIREIVRLQQLLKKWKKLAHASKLKTNNNTKYITLPPIKRSSSNNNISNLSNNTNSPGSKSIKFLKKTLSFTESSMGSNSGSSSSDVVPKGYLAVSVGKAEEDKKRFVIPMEYLGHQAFAGLLREAEEEFGFQQEGVLKIPCEVSMFEKILKIMQQKKKNDLAMFLHEDFAFGTTPTHHAQLCSS